MGIFNRFIKRPKIGSTDTGNLVYQRPFSDPITNIFGSAGLLPKRGVKATQPVLLVPGPAITTVNFAVTGNYPKGLVESPVTDKQF